MKTITWLRLFIVGFIFFSNSLYSENVFNPSDMPPEEFNESVFTIRIKQTKTAQEAFDLLKEQLKNDRIEHKDKVNLKDIKIIAELWKEERGSLQDFPIINVCIEEKSLLLKPIITLFKEELNLNYNNPVYTSIMHHNYTSLEILLRAGASSDLEYAPGWTPLKCAFYKNDHSAIHLLAKYKANFQEINQLAKEEYNQKCNLFTCLSSECINAFLIKREIEKAAKKSNNQ